MQKANHLYIQAHGNGSKMIHLLTENQWIAFCKLDGRQNLKYGFADLFHERQPSIEVKALHCQRSMNPVSLLTSCSERQAVCRSLCVDGLARGVCQRVQAINLATGKSTSAKASILASLVSRVYTCTWAELVIHDVQVLGGAVA